MRLFHQHFRPYRRLSMMSTTEKGATRLRIAALIDNLRLSCLLPAQAKVGPSALRDLEGRPTTIENHVGRGQWSVVMIWSISCHICASEVPRFGAYYASAPEPKFSILGVALDGYARKAAIVETMTRWNMCFPTLVAEMSEFQCTSSELPNASFYGTPTFMLFNPFGKLMKLNVGPVWIAALEEFIRNHRLQ